MTAYYDTPDFETLTADRQIDLGGGVLYDAIDDEAHGLTCIYPTEGPGSLVSIVAQYGCDLDVVLQSATYYLSADGSPAGIGFSDLF